MQYEIAICFSNMYLLQIFKKNTYHKIATKLPLKSEKTVFAKVSVCL